MTSEADAALAAQAPLKEWDTPSYQELPVAEAEAGFINSGVDHTFYS
jgi:hypothetical protein